MHLKSFPLGPLETNCYLLYSDKTAIAVDPGGDPAPVLKFLEARGLTLTHILNTHLHFDHIYGNVALQTATGAPILASPDDAFLLETELGQGGAFGFPPVQPFEFQPLAAGTHVFGDITVEVLATPGHTPGSLSFHVAEAGLVVVGDLLFYRSIGRTDFPGGNLEVLRKSIIERIFLLPETTAVYPGHGPRTHVGDEKRNNPYFGDFAS